MLAGIRQRITAAVAQAAPATCLYAVSGSIDVKLAA
jgi:hypothetical protein